MNLIRLWVLYGALITSFFIIEEIFLGVKAKDTPSIWILSSTWLIIPFLYLFYIAFKPRKTK